MSATGSSAQTCTGQCADQFTLLSPFNSLWTSGTTEDKAVLDANLQAEEDIYANASRAEKAASGTILVIPDISANLLIRTFPNNRNFYYTPVGWPVAPALPLSVAAAVGDVEANSQINAMKPDFGAVDVYGHAYAPLLNGQSDTVGNPPPYQVSYAIFSNPFTPANSSLLAYQNQQTPGLYGVNWALGNSQIGDFPSAHTMASTIDALTYAILAPGYYQQLALGAADFAYALNVNGVHYPLDVIGGRILGTYLVAETLAGKATYAGATFTEDNLPSLSSAMQAYLGGGDSLPFAAPCAAGVATCINNGVIPTAAQYSQAAQNYIKFLTYDFPSIGPTNVAPVVPTDAHVLIATRFPYLSPSQLDDVLASTELPSGGPIDNGSGWARLNLYAASSGYGAFAKDVTVNMNAALGGLNAFDVWSNNISGPGGLTLQGSGTLILAGDNTYAGETDVRGGTLAVTGSLAGDVSISSGATFAGDGAVGRSLTMESGSTYQVAIGPNGANVIHVGGAATLKGASVNLASVGSNPILGNPYTILTANKIIGGFGGVTDDLLFLTPSLGADPTDVFLTLTRNGVAFGSVAATPNQLATANAIDAETIGSPLSEALVGQSAAGARQAFDALSGEIHASAVSAAFDDARLPREAALDRLASLYGAPATGAAAGFAATNAIAASALPTQAFATWGQAFGSFGRIGGDGDAATLDRSVGGFILGADASLDNRYRLGVTGGYTQSTLSVDARASSGHVDSTFAGVYGGATLNALQLRGGALYAYNRYGTDRSVAFPGFNDADSAGYGGDTLQAFGEAGWRIGLSGFSRQASIEPFVGATAMRIGAASFSEAGGAAALNGASAGYDYAATTLGARVAAALFDDASLVARGMLGWRHVFGDVTPTSTLAFANAPSIPFTVAGAPVARDALAVEAGVDWRLTRQATVGVFYSGSLATRDEDNAIKGKLDVAF
jgi:autotransporter-associated beta strand protein